MLFRSKVSAVPPEVETYDIEIVYYTTPVSYTHLDVYKRQLVARVERLAGALFELGDDGLV